MLRGPSSTTRNQAETLREVEEANLTCQLDVLRDGMGPLAAPHERIAATIYAATRRQVTARNATVASEREVLQLSDDPVTEHVRKLRQQSQTPRSTRSSPGKRAACPKRGRELAALGALGIASVDVGGVRSGRFPDARTSWSRFRRRVLGGWLLDRLGLTKWRTLPRESSRWCVERLDAVTGAADRSSQRQMLRAGKLIGRN